MDRYTQHDRFGHFVPLASADCGEWTIAGKFERRLYGDAANRLAAYEDTGLMPEEIAHLRAEVARLERERDSVTSEANQWRKMYCELANEIYPEPEVQP